MTKRSKFFTYCCILFLIGFLFFYSNADALKQVKDLSYRYLKILKDNPIKITRSTSLEESKLIPKGCLTIQIVKKNIIPWDMQKVHFKPNGQLILLKEKW